MSTKETKNNLHREKWEKGREKNSKRSALTYYFHQKLKTQSKILHHFQQSIKFSTKSSINLHIITSHLLHKLIFIKPNTTSLTPSRNLNNNDSSLHFSQTMHQFQQTIYKTTTIITKPVVQIENIITKSKVKEEGEEKNKNETTTNAQHPPSLMHMICTNPLITTITKSGKPSFHCTMLFVVSIVRHPLHPRKQPHSSIHSGWYLLHSIFLWFCLFCMYYCLIWWKNLREGIDFGSE